MKTRVILLALWSLALVAVAQPGTAVDVILNFTNNVDHLDVAALKAEHKELPQFKPSDPVWGVFFASPKLLMAYTVQKMGKTVLQLNVSLLNLAENGWDPLYGADIPLDAAQAAKGYVTFPIIPATFDMDAPGLAKLLHMVPQHANKRLSFKVRIERDSDSFAQSGFFVDLSGGADRFADWSKQLATESEIRAKPLREARTLTTKNYHDLRSDDVFKSDLKKWWAGPAGQTSTILKTMACSSDYSISRNVYGVVTDKQTCGLFVYQQAGKCYVEFRLLGYTSLGGGVFEKQLRDFTSNIMRFKLGNETIFGDRRYEVDCSAFSK